MTCRAWWCAFAATASTSGSSRANARSSSGRSRPGRAPSAAGPSAAVGVSRRRRRGRRRPGSPGQHPAPVHHGPVRPPPLERRERHRGRLVDLAGLGEREPTAMWFAAFERWQRGRGAPGRGCARVSLAGVVLAAGAGTRLRPLRRTSAEGAVAVGFSPLLDLALARLDPLVKAVAANAHHHARQVHVIPRWQGALLVVGGGAEALGTAGALGALRPWLDGRDVLSHKCQCCLRRSRVVRRGLGRRAEPAAAARASTGRAISRRTPGCGTSHQPPRLELGVAARGGAEQLCEDVARRAARSRPREHFCRGGPARRRSCGRSRSTWRRT